MIRGFLTWLSLHFAVMAGFESIPDITNLLDISEMKFGLTNASCMEGFSQNGNTWLFTLEPSRDDNGILIANGDPTAYYKFCDFWIYS